MTLFRTIQLLCTLWFCVGFVCAQDQPKAYPLPTRTSTPLFEIQDRSLLEIDQIHGNWAHLTYGSQEDWVAVSEVLVFPEMPDHRSGGTLLRVNVDPEFKAPSRVGQWQGLLDFATGEERTLRKVTDPVTRQKIKETNREWGRLFVFKTPMYRAQGLRLYSFLDESWSINLAQGKARNQDLLGQALSDSLEDQLLESNRGLLGNRSLFKRGRSYLLELRYSF